jgi:hypothetical protein
MISGYRLLEKPPFLVPAAVFIILEKANDIFSFNLFPVIYVKLLSLLFNKSTIFLSKAVLIFGRVLTNAI